MYKDSLLVYFGNRKMKKLIVFIIVLPLMLMVESTWAIQKKEIEVKKDDKKVVEAKEAKKEGRNESKREDKVEHHPRSAH